ncbi:hypothetical protein BKA56DRAFT_601181, partial [Ilyonectria sp. MPI-CAGE-AT-0026]
MVSITVSRSICRPLPSSVSTTELAGSVTHSCSPPGGGFSRYGDRVPERSNAPSPGYPI